MNDSLKVLWTENAVQNLLGIKEYIGQDSADRAVAWLAKLFEAGESLAHFSGRGRIVPEFNQENLRELLIENYRLVYQVNRASIEVIAVFEGHRRLKVEDIV